MLEADESSGDPTLSVGTVERSKIGSRAARSAVHRYRDSYRTFSRYHAIVSGRWASIGWYS